MAEGEDLRAELEAAEAELAALPRVDECQCAGPHEALALSEARHELVARIGALRARIDRPEPSQP